MKPILCGKMKHCVVPESWRWDQPWRRLCVREPPRHDNRCQIVFAAA